MSIVVLVSVVAVVLVGIYGAIALVKGTAIPPMLRSTLSAPPWDRLDTDTWTQKRRPRPTLFLTPSADGQHKLWVHYYDDEAGNVPGLTVEACVAPASPSRATELPGLPDGLAGSVSFEVEEDGHWVSRPPTEEHVAQASEWLADAGPLAALPGSKLSIDPSRSGGFRIHVYWNGGPDELALAVRVAESVEARIVPQVRIDGRPREGRG